MTVECDCEDFTDPNWMILAGTLVGMALLCFAVIFMLGVIRSNHREDEISRRAKYEACQNIEHEITRTTCINGWG